MEHIDWKKVEESLLELESCKCCPRNCGVNRLAGKTGYCKSDASYSISSICCHKGEEPVINGKNGICNIFFSHCNLQCIYCQNYQISRNKSGILEDKLQLPQIIDQILALLDEGCESVGFVSPSHFIPQVKSIIYALQSLGKKPIFVYNTNGYDKPETLRQLEGLIDIYLPDFKYWDAAIAGKYSDAADYPEVAKAAIKEMYRQKGSSLIIDDNGQAVWGLLIRHLVLPGQTEDSKAILRFIAEELSPSLHISLMSQYYPTEQVTNHPELSKFLTRDEYESVVAEMERLGLVNGFLQEMESQANYQPNFQKQHPFEG
jgi:putative pyruvate formate lyase activating enzyme